jgi:hypothetical protein
MTNVLTPRLKQLTEDESGLWIPDIIEFTLSDGFLNRNLYPRQATALKVAFLQDELFTDYDHEVIEGWARSFRETEDNGIQPDIYERIRICKEEGRPWFREWLNVIGRRGSKGYLGGIGAAYVLWHYICKGDPQGFYGIDRDKRLAMMVFAGKKEQATANQWKDVTDIIKGGRCFSPYFSKSLGESLTLRAPHDNKRINAREDLGIYEDGDMATFIILPKESTPMASRGPAVFALLFDEMAHVVRQVAKSDAAEVYQSASPALDTFGVDAWMYEASSPWAKTGQFYENCQQALAVSDGTDGLTPGEIVRPEMLMIQLTSWDPYIDWERAEHLPTMSRTEYDHPRRRPIGGVPHRRSFGFCLPAQRRAQQVYDRQLQRIEAANPETFAVERRSKWAAVLDAYLNEDRVKAIWLPWPEENPLNLYMKEEGKLAVLYKAHGDPSKSGANFGFAIAHVVRYGDDDFPHVVFDYITHWEPASFPDNDYQVDYDLIEKRIRDFINVFIPTEVSFDQGYSNWMISRLIKWVRTRNFPKRVAVFERTATAPMNWTIAETFKTAIGLGLVHAPYYEQAQDELLFLQKVAENKVDHPTSGPVQTKDVADCMMILVHALIGNEISAFIGEAFSSLSPRFGQQGGFPTQAEQAAEDNLGDPVSALRNWGGQHRSFGSTYSPARGRFSGSPGRRRRR